MNTRVYEARRSLGRRFKSLWLKALRDKRYKQGRGTLKDMEGKFCCLGVALHLKSSHRWGKKADGKSDVPGFGWGGFESCAVNELSPVLGIPKTQLDTLAGMNDAGKSFEEIADWIEERVK